MGLQKAMKRYIPMSETMFYILLSLREPNHGYGIMLSGEGSHRRQGHHGGGNDLPEHRQAGGRRADHPRQEEDRKKIYVITDLGTQVLTTEAKRIRELYRNTEGIAMKDTKRAWMSAFRCRGARRVRTMV